MRQILSQIQNLQFHNCQRSEALMKSIPVKIYGQVPGLMDKCDQIELQAHPTETEIEMK